MKLEPLGDLAVLVTRLEDPCGLAALLNAELPIGLIEAVPAYETLGLYFGDTPDLGEVEAMLRDYSARDPGSVVAPRLIEIPCRYDGEDLPEVATLTGLSQEEIIALHSAVEYRCYAVGFTPGFAYLGYLDDRLVLPRRNEPRVRVPAGSVAIAGRQTAVYPSASPGGWWLLGTSDMRLVDVEDNFFAIGPGDRVRFIPS